jgi:acyl-CoA thioester hydrolase
MDYKFFQTSPLQMRFSDIDMLGHATNSIYQQYFDLGRMKYFKDVLMEEMDWREEGLILVNFAVNYISQIKLYDEIEVRTKVVKLGNKSLHILQQVFNITRNEIAAEGKSIMVGYHGNSGVSIPVPMRWRERIVRFEKDITFEL